MTSARNASLFSATTLAVLLLSCTAQSAEVSTTPEGPSEEPSGEPPGEELRAFHRSSDLLSASPIWRSFIAITNRAERQFEEEFHNQLKYQFPGVKWPQICCPVTNCSMEICLRRLAEGLLKCMVLLKHVEKEYPANSILPEAKHYSVALVNQIKEKMEHPERIAELSEIQEEQLLQEQASGDTFKRRINAYSILYQLHYFLIDGKRALTKVERRSHKVHGNLLSV
ncbi:interleukin-6-like [Lampris incognitus]|uniref:interleukin-6-like n=1 Tax=Lampris incognitus TaxID=2546036 RepID=UPI0024B57A46|nr:interleukin-6-like [Lampris incognitus]